MTLPQVRRAALPAGLVAGATLAGLRAAPPGGADRWRCTNHAGRQVSLLGGPALVAGATVGTLLRPGAPGRHRIAAAIAVLGAGAVGLYDDLSESRRLTAKGIRGHLGALMHGRVTTGAVKAVALPVVGLGAAVCVCRGRFDVLVGAGLVAGYANLANLLDLRPGRCLKFGLLHAALTPGSVGPLGAGVALLPVDLSGRVMLGDCGANALGAALGAAVLTGRGRLLRAAHLAAVVALTLSSERRSFTEVIAAIPVLAWLDGLGRADAN